jgi:beta-glucanase (GH16 family)
MDGDWTFRRMWLSTGRAGLWAVDASGMRGFPARFAFLVIGAIAMLTSAAIVASPADAAGAGTPDCGPDISTSTGGTWQCTFADEFDGASLDPSKWVAQRTDTSGYTNGPTACYVDSPNNISVSAGTLKLTAREESAPFTCQDPWGAFQTRYTSGMVSTAEGRFSQAYGRFEVRAKISAAQVKGLQTAFWLWPVDANKYGAFPGSGEIDIAEMYSQYPDRAIPYIHYTPAAPDPNVTNTGCLISNPDAFHTYAVEWTPSSIKVIYDGQTCLVDSWNPASPLVNQQPFDQPFIVALTQALGIGTNQFDPATTPLPATSEVDYVRVWKQLSPGTPAAPTPPQPPQAQPPQAQTEAPQLQVGSGGSRTSGAAQRLGCPRSSSPKRAGARSGRCGGRRALAPKPN